MLQTLQAAWRARRVLIAGGQARDVRFLRALLGELGARSAALPAGASGEAVARALTDGRVACLIIPCQPAQEDPIAQLRTLDLLLREAREAGVPLVILLQSRYPDETRAGLYQAILSLYASGADEGLLGDRVSVLCVRHPPDCAPLSRCADALYLGARFLLGETELTGVVDLGGEAPPPEEQTCSVRAQVQAYLQAMNP